jgi:hypothetical protein
MEAAATFRGGKCNPSSCAGVQMADRIGVAAGSFRWLLSVEPTSFQSLPKFGPADETQGNYTLIKSSTSADIASVAKMNARQSCCRCCTFMATKGLPLDFIQTE